jgi:3-(3-hydroxy-phenyl)propionate hydroxylase
MTSAFPSERWFWFDPPFHRNQSALLHRQANDVWRVDFQLGPDADPEEEKKPERILPRLQAMLGEQARFEIEWASVYTFQCRRMRSFREGRALFVGDAAHLVSPFGARGANSGIQDCDNLVWKLELVLAGLAPESLLDSYDDERGRAADENIRHSTRSTDFITPKSRASRRFRDAVLQLAKRHSFARRIVNSGRLSLPTILAQSALNTGDTEVFAGSMVPGAPAADAPVSSSASGDAGWFLEFLHDGFTLVLFADETITDTTLRALASLARDPIGCSAVLVGEVAGNETFPRELPGGLIGITARDGLLAERYDAKPGSAYLFRPDQHICARWRVFDAAEVRAAISRATAKRRNGAAREAA